MSTADVQHDWIPDTDSFGARLALVRWRMGWNIREAERECNLTQNSWAGYESGALPRKFVEITNRIVLRTGVNKMWLMTGAGTPETPPSDYKVGVSGGTVTHVDFRRRSVEGSIA